MAAIEVRSEKSDSETLARLAIKSIAEKFHASKSIPPLARARGLHEAMTVLGWTRSQIAEAAGFRRSTVSKLFALLDLPDEVQALIDQRRLPWSTAYVVGKSGLREAEKIDLALEASEKKWTGDQVAVILKSSQIIPTTPSEIPVMPASATQNGVVPYRLTVEQYLKIIEAGVFPEGTHVELLGGVIVEKMTKYHPHNFSADALSAALRRLIPDGYLVREEKSVVLGGYWRPEPDIAVVRGPRDRYRHRDPESEDIALLVEVADSSYETDRGMKWRRYAARGIHSYWIVNIGANSVEVYSDPEGRGGGAQYRTSRSFGPDEGIPVMIDGREVGRVATRDILP